ncbi:unnamed protein product [Prunus armeniaca]
MGSLEVLTLELSALFGKKLWHLEVPNKVKILLWRASLNILPTALNLVQRKVLVSAYCSGCRTATEDVIHAFWGCKRSIRFWALTSFNIDSAVRQGSFADFLEVMFLTLSDGDLERFVCCCWRVWKLRNEVFYGKTIDGLPEMIEWTMEFLEQFKIHNTRTEPARVPRFIRWIKPPSSSLLLNCDGVTRQAGCNRGVGGVLRDSAGNFIWGFADQGPAGLDVLATECAALHMGLLKAAELGVSDFLVASNTQEVVVLLKGSGELWSNLGNIMDDIRRLLAELCVNDVIFQPRSGNRVAHSLAQFGLREQHHSFWAGLALDWLVSLLVIDMEGG